MSQSEENDEKLLGTTVAGKYRVDRLVGRGGMGAVFEATNVAIGKRVALKFLDRDAARDQESAMRFQREAEAASAVESAHIVHIFDSGMTDDGRPFLVMELLHGEDLRSVLKRDSKMPLPEAIHVTGQVLRALSRAHAAGIIHRDLKPDNVYLCRRDDDPMFVKIVDFGISKVTSREATANTLTRRGMVLGTAFYMSPEQAQAFRDIDGRTDLWSAGVILYEALAGRPPHIGSVYEAVLIDICTKDAADIRTLAPEVPDAVADILTRALKRERDHRFQSAADFYDALAMAAPGILRTGGPGGVRSTNPSHPDTARIAPAQTPGADGGRIATAEGTAVRPSSAGDGRTQTRRTIVTAVVAALGAMTLTAVLTTTNKPSPRTPETASGASADPATPLASSSVLPAADAGAATVADADSTVATSPSGSEKPTQGGKPTGKHPTGKHPTGAPTTSGTKPTGSPTGVATGLKLDPHGP